MLSSIQGLGWSFLLLLLAPKYNPSLYRLSVCPLVASVPLVWGNLSIYDTVLKKKEVDRSLYRSPRRFTSCNQNNVFNIIKSIFVDSLFWYLNCQIFPNMRDSENKLSSFGYLWHSFSIFKQNSMVILFLTCSLNLWHTGLANISNKSLQTES